MKSIRSIGDNHLTLLECYTRPINWNFRLSEINCSLRCLNQCEFGDFIRSDFADVHGRTIRANGNGVGIVETTPVIDDFLSAWIDGETAYRNWGRCGTIDSIHVVTWTLDKRLKYGNDFTDFYLLHTVMGDIENTSQIWLLDGQTSVTFAVWALQPSSVMAGKQWILL